MRVSKRKPRYRYTYTADVAGRTYTYFRRGNEPKVRLPNPESADFWDAYQTALHASPTELIRKAARIERERKKGPAVGVYLLMLEGEIVYVGSSRRMLLRVSSHRANGRPFDQAFYIGTKEDERLALEYLLIRRLRPNQNRHGSVGYVSRDHEAIAK